MTTTTSKSRYDDVEQIMADLEQEKKYKEQIETEIEDLEKSISENEEYLRHLEEVHTTGSAEDNEWKCRFEIQKHLDNHLAEHKTWLETELAETEWKYHTSNYPEAMNCNVDVLTELELLRLVKHMERARNDYCTTVRTKECRLEKEAKDFHQFDETRRALKVELKNYHDGAEPESDNLVSDPATCEVPLYSPSSVHWMDSESVEISSGSKPRSKSRAKSKDGRRSCSKSPTKGRSRRSVSRTKKEESDPDRTTVTEPDVTTEQSEDKWASGSDGATRGDEAPYIRSYFY